MYPNNLAPKTKQNRYRPEKGRVSYLRFSVNPRNLVLWRAYFFRFETSLMPWESIPSFC